MSAGGFDQPPKLNPKDLFEKRVRRDASRLKAYNQLLHQINQRIYSTSQLTGNANYIMYTVPPFIFGLPKLDLQDCIVYLVYQLRQAGYEVRYTYPNLLYISWRHHEKAYLLNQNPIMQAMIPPEVKKERKRLSNIPSGQGQTTREIKQVSFAAPPSMDAGPKPMRNVGDYEPPNSFIQTLQKPTGQKSNSASVLADLWSFQ
jgi:hypothetical protein